MLRIAGIYQAPPAKYIIAIIKCELLLFPRRDDGRGSVTPAGDAAPAAAALRC